MSNILCHLKLEKDLQISGFPQCLISGLLTLYVITLYLNLYSLNVHNFYMKQYWLLVDFFLSFSGIWPSFFFSFNIILKSVRLQNKLTNSFYSKLTLQREGGRAGDGGQERDSRLHNQMKNIQLSLFKNLFIFSNGELFQESKT